MAVTNFGELPWNAKYLLSVLNVREVQNLWIQKEQARYDDYCFDKHDSQDAPANQLDFFFFYSISYFIFSICSWVRPEYFLIRLMPTPSASMFLAISKAFSFLLLISFHPSWVWWWSCHQSWWRPSPRIRRGSGGARTSGYRRYPPFPGGWHPVGWFCSAVR